MMFSAIDNSWVVLLVIAALSAISNWLQKRSQSQQRPDSGRGAPTLPPPPRSTTPRPETTPTSTPERPAERDWETELRRLFEGDAPSTPPPVPPPPITPPKPIPSRATPPAPKPRPRPIPRSIERPVEEGPAITLAALTESEEAYRKAKRLHDQTAIHMRQIAEQTKRQYTRDSAGHREPATREMAAAKELIKNPKTVRQAMIVAFIFGSPKAFEN